MIIFGDICCRLISTSLSAAVFSESLGILAAIRLWSWNSTWQISRIWDRKMTDRRYSVLGHGSSWEAVQAESLFHVS